MVAFHEKLLAQSAGASARKSATGDSSVVGRCVGCALSGTRRWATIRWHTHATQVVWAAHKRVFSTKTGTIPRNWLGRCAPSNSRGTRWQFGLPLGSFCAHRMARNLWLTFNFSTILADLKARRGGSRIAGNSSDSRDQGFQGGVCRWPRISRLSRVQISSYEFPRCPWPTKRASTGFSIWFFHAVAAKRECVSRWSSFSRTRSVLKRRFQMY